MKEATELDRDDRERPPVDLTITRMRRRHLRAVLRIEEASVHHSWSLGLFMNELALRSTRLYAVALHHHDVVGFGGLLFTGPDAHVTTLSTDPRFYRRQVATRLLLALSRAAITRECRHLTLEVRESNAAAIALYDRFGFESAGVRKNYYADLNEDAIIMWAHHIDEPAYADRLDGIEAAVAGRTRVERLTW
jgi:ribosomal-protein-alanine N-acetyltransferase